MKNSFLRASLIILSVFATVISVQAQDLELLKCHTVNSEVGLIVRDAPSSDGNKVGAVGFGEKVTLAGKPVKGEPFVHAITKKTGISTWIAITSPYKGYILYFSDDDLAFNYIVPCE